MGKDDVYLAALFAAGGWRGNVGGGLWGNEGSQGV